MAFLAVDGVRLFYETHGSGTPLVFVHGGFGGLGTGAGGQRPGWLERFAASHRVVLFDRRSSGRSDYPHTRHSMSVFAADIHHLVTHLGLERVHVWGTSAGGPIAMTYASGYPDEVRSLVVTDSAPWLSKDDEVLAGLRRRIGVLADEGAEAAYQARREEGTVGLNLFTSSGKGQPPPRTNDAKRPPSGADAIRAQLAGISREERVAKYSGELRTYDAYVDWSGVDDFVALTMPVLVLYGTEDRVFPGVDWGSLCNRAQNLTYRPYPGADHGVTSSDPAALDEVLGFLAAN